MAVLKNLEQENERLKRELAEAKAAKEASMWFKVADKGGASVYGLGRFPVTLYYEQWQALFDNADRIKDFLEANRGKLKMKS